MKHLLLLFLSLSPVTCIFSQEWQWVQTAGGNDLHNIGKAVCSDPHGNAIVTGYHRPGFRLHRNPQDEATVELANYERKDNRMFVAKYGQDGQLHWANYAKGYFAEGLSVDTDEQGCIYVTGRFAEETVFSSQDASKTHLNGYYPGMMFLAKYSPTGRLMWVVKGGSRQGQSGGEVLKVSGGQVFIAGQAEVVAGEALEFEDVKGHTHFFTPVKSLPFAEARVGFVAAYDLQGRLSGVNFYGGSQADVRLTGLAVDPAGTCYLTGLLTGRMSLQGRILQAEAFSTEGFCLSLNSKGELNWAAQIKGGIDPACGPRVTKVGDKVALVYTGKSQTLFTVETQGLETESPDAGHLGLVLLSREGALKWHHYGAMSRGKVAAETIVADREGGLFVGGFYLGELRMGKEVLHSSGFHRVNDPDLGEYSWWDKNAFVARFHPEGPLDWVRCSEGIQEEVSHGLAQGPQGQLYMTGYFVSGGNSTLGSLPLRDVGKVNIFLSRLDQAPVQGRPEATPMAIRTRSDASARRTIDKEEIWVSNHTLVLSLWDNHQIDGDVISLYAGEQCILEKYRLDAGVKTLTLELPSGEYQLRLHAENTGEIYPNTATITIDDGHYRQTVLLASDMERSEAVRIKVR